MPHWLHKRRSHSAHQCWRRSKWPPWRCSEDRCSSTPINGNKKRLTHPTVFLLLLLCYTTALYCTTAAALLHYTIQLHYCTMLYALNWTSPSNCVSIVSIMLRYCTVLYLLKVSFQAQTMFENQSKCLGTPSYEYFSYTTLHNFDKKSFDKKLRGSPRVS